jgi:hypothetical protein
MIAQLTTARIEMEDLIKLAWFMIIGFVENASHSHRLQPGDAWNRESGRTVLTVCSYSEPTEMSLSRDELCDLPRRETP